MDNNELIRIVNYKQASMYVKNGLKPIDVEYTDRLVFVFNRSETKELYDKWCNFELS